MSGTDPLYKGDELDASVKADAPDADGSTSTWKAVGYPDKACATTRDNKVNTVGVEIGPASAGPGTPGHFKPDNLIRKARPGSRWFGEGIFNGTGRRQRVHSYIHKGGSSAFYITIENDGATVDDIVVGGRGLQHGFRVVRYSSHGRWGSAWMISLCLMKFSRRWCRS